MSELRRLMREFLWEEDAGRRCGNYSDPCSSYCTGHDF